MTCLAIMRAPQACQLQRQQDTSSDIPKGESFPDEASSVSVQIMVEFKRQEHHVYTEVYSAIERKTD